MKIGGSIGKAWGEVKKEAGNQWSQNVKTPFQTTTSGVSAVGSAIKQGSTKPIEKWAGEAYSSNVKKPLGRYEKQWNQTVTGLKKSFGVGGESPGQPVPVAQPIDYSRFKLNLAGSPGEAEQASFGSFIGSNEDQNAARANIQSQYGAMSNLAKMRESAQRQSEGSAISRRLAASGMGASGAGMRMQQQAEQQAGRRGAETQLALAGEQAGAERQAQEQATARNLQREQLRMGAAQAESDRAFRERQFAYEQAANAAAFEREGQVIAENQKIARDVQRYNDRGMLGQLLGDLFGGGAWSTKYPFGQR
jgi:hypothetical protein